MVVERVKKLEEKALERNSTKELILPSWPDNKRGTPNAFLRSALFSATRGRNDEGRPYIYGQIMASQKGFTLKYTGKQLNQDDLTLWETLVHMAKDQPLGNTCEFSSYGILKTMGLSTGGDEQLRLKKGITRLIACSVEIAFEGSKAYEAALISSVASDNATDKHVITLNKGLMKLYDSSTWVDWEQRAKLRKKPLAQALHGYYSSHKVPHDLLLKTIQQYTGCSNKQPAGFKRQVITALEELVKVGLLESYSIVGDKVHVKKV